MPMAFMVSYTILEKHKIFQIFIYYLAALVKAIRQGLAREGQCDMRCYEVFTL